MIIAVLRPSAEGNERSQPVLPHESEADVALVEPPFDAGPEILGEMAASGLYILGSEPAAPGSETDINGKSSSIWNESQRCILAHGLKLDMPVLAVSDGLLLLNEVFGGKQAPILTLPHEVGEDKRMDSRFRGKRVGGIRGGMQKKERDSVTPGAERDKKGRRVVYVSPGSKTAAIIGAGGFFRLGADDALPTLTDNQRAARLLASAYGVEDGVIEGLESAEHSWVLGFRSDLGAEEKLPRGFGGIFQSFVERAQGFHQARRLA